MEFSSTTVPGHRPDSRPGCCNRSKRFRKGLVTPEKICGHHFPGHDPTAYRARCLHPCDTAAQLHRHLALLPAGRGPRPDSEVPTPRK